MDQVTNRLPVDFVWPTVGRPGQVPLWALVPTPGQPRLEFDPIELNALADTMRPENDSELLEILTVRELTEEERLRYEPARYMIKSGERRWRAAAIAGLEMLEVRVKRWKSVAKEKLDTWMFNENRVNLSFYENALYLADLIKEWGWQTQAEVVRGTGKDAMWVSDHMAFSKLHPAIQEQMHPKVPKSDQYKRETAVFFARFDKDIQLDVHNHMPKKCRTVPQQIGWMNQYLVNKGITVPTRAREPRKIRELVSYYADHTERKALAFLAAGDFDRLFENAGEAQVNELLGKLGDAEFQFNELLKKIRGLATAVSERAAPPQPKPAALKPPAPAPRPAPIGGVGKSNVAQAAGVLSGSGKEKTVTFFDDKIGRKVTDKVSQARYLQLWDAGKLWFQLDGGTTRPDFMPTPEQAAKDWEKYC